MKYQPPVLPSEDAQDKASLPARLMKQGDYELHHRRLAEEMEIIAEIGRLISSTLDIEEVYERFAAEVRKLIYFDRISVHLNNPDGETFTIAYVSGFDIAGRRQGDKVPLAGSISEVLFRMRNGLFLHPASAEEIVGRFPHASSATTFRAGMRSIMAVPLISRDEVIGALHFRATKPNVYSEQDLLLAGRIGRQIAGAIANAQLYAGLRKTEEDLRRSRQISTRLAEEMAIIAEIGRLVSSTLNIEEVYERFAEETRKLIPFDRISVNLINPDGESLTNAYVSGFDIPERRPGNIVPMAGSLSEHLMRERSGRIIHVEDFDDLVRQFPSVTVHLVVRAGIRSMIGVPLISRDEVIGILHFRSKKPNAYTEQDLRLAERIGEQIAGAVANAKLYGERMRAEVGLRDALDHLESTVRERTIELEEINTALRVLLKQREADQRNLGQGIQANIDQLVMPFLTRLRATQTSEQDLAYLNILETNLNNIISPFINQLSAAYRSLTPKEIKIAFLIKEGKSSKEIAKLMGVSVGTIVTHRNNIRKKLRLKSKNTNLRSHLLFVS